MPDPHFCFMYMTEGISFWKETNVYCSIEIRVMWMTGGWIMCLVLFVYIPQVLDASQS